MRRGICQINLAITWDANTFYTPTTTKKIYKERGSVFTEKIPNVRLSIYKIPHSVILTSVCCSLDILLYCFMAILFYGHKTI